MTKMTGEKLKTFLSRFRAVESNVFIKKIAPDMWQTWCRCSRYKIEHLHGSECKPK